MIEISNWSKIVIVVLAVASIGICRIIYIITNLSIRKLYTNKYLKTYNKWLKTNKDEDLYTWLTQDAGKIQTELGQDGVAVNYVAPVILVEFKNYQIIVNTLPLIHDGVAMKNEVNACKDALNRHIGNLKHKRRRYLLTLLNPFKWVLEGVRLIITLPIYVFYWAGLYQYIKITGFQDSNVFRIISGIVSVISVCGMIIGLVVDWGSFWTIIVKIMKQ